MGISATMIQILARKLKPLTGLGKLLVYGVQGVEGSYTSVSALLETAGYPHRALSVADIKTDSTTEFGQTLHQDALFKLLGFDTVETLDYYPDEHPSHTLDLNEPIPHRLHGQYDMVYDGGTMEHCFDVKSVLFNSVRLVKPGGWMIHVVPVSGLVNHGFYQFSPTLFFDFYGVNGFENLSMEIAFDQHYLPLGPRDTVPGDFFGRPSVVIFMAQKPAHWAADTPITIPIQNVYQQKFGQNAGTDLTATTSEVQPLGLLTRLKFWIPWPNVRHALVYVWQYLKFQKRLKRI